MAIGGLGTGTPVASTAGCAVRKEQDEGPMPET
jgi:hypothetical protein